MIDISSPAASQSSSATRRIPLCRRTGNHRKREQRFPYDVDFAAADIPGDGRLRHASLLVIARLYPSVGATRSGRPRFSPGQMEATGMVRRALSFRARVRYIWPVGFGRAPLLRFLQQSHNIGANRGRVSRKSVQVSACSGHRGHGTPCPSAQLLQSRNDRRNRSIGRSRGTACRAPQVPGVSFDFSMIGESQEES